LAVPAITALLVLVAGWMSFCYPTCEVPDGTEFHRYGCGSLVERMLGRDFSTSVDFALLLVVPFVAAFAAFLVVYWAGNHLRSRKQLSSKDAEEF
jgi:hypothetical protein